MLFLWGISDEFFVSAIGSLLINCLLFEGIRLLIVSDVARWVFIALVVLLIGAFKVFQVVKKGSVN